MKISIITPVKNSEKYIAETVESVINQRGDFNIEYLIMDGGSSDATLKICNEYLLQLESLNRKLFCNSIDIKIISKPDTGVYDALANGLKLVTGDITCYINSDDYYLPTAFSCVCEILIKYPEIKWLTGLPIRYNEKGHITDFYVPWQYNSNLILKGFNGKYLPIIQQESVFWRSELNQVIDLEKLKNYKLAGDFFLWHSFAKQFTQLYVVDSFLGGNRLRAGQLSEDKRNYLIEFNSIRDNAYLWDYGKVFFYWLIEKFAGKPVKQRLSRNRASFKNRNWVLR